MKKNKPETAIPESTKDDQTGNSEDTLLSRGGSAPTAVKKDVLQDADRDGSSVSAMEKQLLNQAFNPSYDADIPIKGISLDDRDDDGEKLEESGLEENLFGGDLDDDLIREEDEETEGEDPQQ